VEVPRADRRPASRALLAVAAAGAIATALCIALIDEPFARWNAQWEPNPVWDGGIAVLYWLTGIRVWPLASAVAVVVAMLVAVAVPRWRGAAPAWMLVAGTHLLVRLATRYIKVVTGQLRPTEWLEQGGGVWWRDGGIAFPSGDVTLVASLAIPVILLWPRARPLVAAMVAVIGFTTIARVATNAHFIGDVTGSITLVAVVAWAVAYLVRPFRR
jgi:membrane-associated phospholipid phosphatase